MVVGSRPRVERNCLRPFEFVLLGDLPGSPLDEHAPAGVRIGVDTVDLESDYGVGGRRLELGAPPDPYQNVPVEQGKVDWQDNGKRTHAHRDSTDVGLAEQLEAIHA